MLCRLIINIPQSNEACLQAFPPIPMSGFMCSVFCLSHTVFQPPLSFVSFCWFSFTSSFPDALRSEGSGKKPRRGRDHPGMSSREARQRKNQKPNPTQHPHVLILVVPQSLAWSTLPLRRQMMVKLFCYSFQTKTQLCVTGLSHVKQNLGNHYE